MKALAFDFGASSGRAILGELREGKLTLTEVHRFSNDPVAVGGTLYWDILRLFYELKQGLALCFTKHGGADSLGIDTWGVDFGLLDKEGRLLANPVHYRDARTEGMIEASFALVPQKEQYKQCGLQFMPFNTLYQWMALQKTDPALLEQADKLLFTPDLFAYFLTGEKVSEASIASTSQCKVPGKPEWNVSLLTRMGLSPSLLCQLVPAGTKVGKVKKEIMEELNITGEPPVIAVNEHDTASAVMAIPAKDEKFAYISSGTWSLLGTEADRPYLTDEAFAQSFTNEGGYQNTTRLLKNIMGLWIIQECRRHWIREGEELSFARLVELAEQAPAFGSFIDPDDQLFMPPHNMPGRIADYCLATGQRPPQTKGETVRLVLESLALKYRSALDGLEAIVGFRLPVLHVAGGGSQNVALCQYTANAIARPVLAGPVEATAIGNVMCQFIATGAVKDLAEARAIVADSFDTVTYHPKDTAQWDEAYRRFCQVCLKQ